MKRNEKEQQKTICKRCGQNIDSENYAEHLVRFHYDFSEMKNGKINLLHK